MDGTAPPRFPDSRRGFFLSNTDPPIRLLPWRAGRVHRHFRSVAPRQYPKDACLHFVSCMGGLWASILRVAPVPCLPDPEAFQGSNHDQLHNRAQPIAYSRNNSVWQRMVAGGADAWPFQGVNMQYLQLLTRRGTPPKYAEIRVKRVNHGWRLRGGLTACRLVK